MDPVADGRAKVALRRCARSWPAVATCDFVVCPFAPSLTNDDHSIAQELAPQSLCRITDYHIPRHEGLHLTASDHPYSRCFTRGRLKFQRRPLHLKCHFHSILGLSLDLMTYSTFFGLDSTYSSPSSPAVAQHDSASRTFKLCQW